MNMQQLYQLGADGLWVSPGRPSIIAGGDPPPPDPDYGDPGTYQPGPLTTGPIPGTVLSDTFGDITVSGTETITGLRIYGRVTVPSGANLTMRNCELRGPSGTLPGGAVVTVAGTALIEDTSIDVTDRESYMLNGIMGKDYTMRRCEITRTVDAVGLTYAGGNVTIEACWFHRPYYSVVPTSVQSSGYTHNDGVQFHTGANITIRGNMIGGPRVDADYETGATEFLGEDFSTSGIIIQQTVAPGSSIYARIENVLVEKNWFQGAAASVNLNYINGNDLSGNVVVKDNHFYRQTGKPTYYILNNSTLATLSGNTFEDTGTLVPIVNI